MRRVTTTGSRILRVRDPTQSLRVQHGGTTDANASYADHLCFVLCRHRCLPAANVANPVAYRSTMRRSFTCGLGHMVYWITSRGLLTAGRHGILGHVVYSHRSRGWSGSRGCYQPFLSGSQTFRVDCAVSATVTSPAENLDTD